MTRGRDAAGQGIRPAPPSAHRSRSRLRHSILASVFPTCPGRVQSILAVPILARDKLEGALNVRTRSPRDYTEAEIDLLVAIASQVAQSLEHAKLYADAQRRVHELEALARISEAVSESLYLEESLEAIVKTTMDALSATGAALVLEDGKIAWPEGRPALRGAPALRWKRARHRRARLATGTPRSPTRIARSSRRSRTTPRSRLEHAAPSCAASSLRDPHRVKNNLQPWRRCCGFRRVRPTSTRAGPSPTR